MLCPNCMSPHVEPLAQDSSEGDETPDSPEPLMHCTECEYGAPKSEFLPEDYR